MVLKEVSPGFLGPVIILYLTDEGSVQQANGPDIWENWG